MKEYPWTYTVESYNNYFIIRVNEMPGIEVDSENLDDGVKELKILIDEAMEHYRKLGIEPSWKKIKK